MQRSIMIILVGAATLAGQTGDRVYTADQTSNTVSVIDPATNKMLGAIHLGDDVPAALLPLYRGELLVHGLGFSPDHKTLDVVSIGSNSVCLAIYTLLNGCHPAGPVLGPVERAVFADGGGTLSSIAPMNSAHFLRPVDWRCSTDIPYPGAGVVHFPLLQAPTGSRRLRDL